MENAYLTNRTDDSDAATGEHTMPGTMASEWGADRESSGEPSRELLGTSRGKLDRVGYPLSRALFVFVGLILALTPWTAEYFIERFSHAATRGRIQAEYEHAVAQIAEHSSRLREISIGSQLVFKKIRPSVVSIQAKQTSEILDPNSQGSGFVISEDGYILTNYHVVDDADAVYVEMEGRRKIRAMVVGHDATTDLAVVKIDASGLVPIEWGDSDQLQIGSMVWAIGSPFGLRNSITQGIVSGLHRGGQRNDRLQSFLQTDAAVNPGNSGGPLVDEEGSVVGVNTLIYGEQFQGISFAVPSNICREMCEQIIRKGKVVRGFFGVMPTNVYLDDLEQLGLREVTGAFIQQVVDGTPAEAAGLRAGDVITHWNGKAVPDFQSLYRMIWLTPPHSRARVDYVRRGQPHSVDVIIEQMKNDY